MLHWIVPAQRWLPRSGHVRGQGDFAGCRRVTACLAVNAGYRPSSADRKYTRTRVLCCVGALMVVEGHYVAWIGGVVGWYGCRSIWSICVKQTTFVLCRQTTGTDFQCCSTAFILVWELIRPRVYVVLDVAAWRAVCCIDVWSAAIDRRWFPDLPHTQSAWDTAYKRPRGHAQWTPRVADDR